jgi:hypothetical protein
MIRRTLGASLLAALFLVTPALAEEVTIRRPIEGGSLHVGRLDMVVYYVPVDSDLLEVTATFAPKGGGDPLRVVMGLADRDAVAFSMPGYQDSLYTFSRSGEEVTVSSKTATHLRANALMHQTAVQTAACLLPGGARVRSAGWGQDRAA